MDLPQPAIPAIGAEEGIAKLAALTVTFEREASFPCPASNIAGFAVEDFHTLSEALRKH
ncbi:hypothetical protein [Methylobacterium sp. D54C]